MRNIWQAADYQCKCKLVIEVYGDLVVHGHTGQVITVNVEDEDVMVIPAGITPYYRSPTLVAGFDQDGHDVEVRDGKVTRMFSLNEKAAAVRDADENGASSAAKKLGVSRQVVQGWMRSSELRSWMNSEMSLLYISHSCTRK